jgi:Alkyl sulfatase C-terminal
MTLTNGALNHYPKPPPGDSDLILTLTKPQLLAMLAGAGMDGVEHAGELGTIQRLLSVLDRCQLRHRHTVGTGRLAALREDVDSPSDHETDDHE